MKWVENQKAWNLKGEIMTLCPEMETETKPLPVRERPATLKQKAMVAPNKPFYWPVIIILAATAGLAALGLFFCWKSPIGEWRHPGSDLFFKRQLVYLMIDADCLRKMV